MKREPSARMPFCSWPICSTPTKWAASTRSPANSAWARSWSATAASGLIGSYLVRAAPQFAPQFQIIGLTRAQLDLTDFAAVRREFREQRPDLIIHCAALSRSPECQARPGLARALNVDVTANLV